MKIELNPSKMTLDELNDCIAELSAHRERLMTEEKELAELALNMQAVELVDKLVDAATRYNVSLQLYYKSGRIRTLLLKDINGWNIKLDEKVEE